jgi:hypothetical protein
MVTNDEYQNKWQTRVQTVGFWETAIGFLRDRLYREYDKKRVDNLIRRLGKYEPRQEIVKLLCLNPVWQQRANKLIRELPEVTADLEIHKHG